ncbi:polysaccharide deacetylase family protein [Nocardiopsis halotolerans]|uniref:polysaccharide deacetylase family protein n=1 Tax=Nocardiopsis halotolerans TaxID=124252 RepID=UPI0003498940|nr:polysaccharide deacetylase family protein [Nocardiopsis halotolerans]
MVPLVAVTSLRRKLSVSAVLALLLLSGCHTVEEQPPHAEALRTPPEDVPGMRARTMAVTTEHSVVSYRFPLLGGGHPLTVETRTAMAARQTAFLERLSGEGTPELHQDATILAASPEVVGVRLTATTSSGGEETFEARTLWYDDESGQILPWTSLFRDEKAIEQAHLALAEVLEEGYGMPGRQLPGIVGEVAGGDRKAPGNDTENAAASPSADTAPSGDGEPEPLGLSDPERAREAAQRWTGSPLEDLAFSTAGGLAVRMDPSQVPGSGRTDEVLLPVSAADTEDLLSGLGYRAREAALNDGGLDDDLPLGEPGDGLSDQGRTLDCQRLRCVALTFDDGPGEHTDELLDTLEEYDARATFYVLGSLVDDFPALMERMAEEGHEVGNHTWKHGDLAEMSGEEIEEDIGRTNEAVREVTGSDPPTIRPPYGSLDETVRETVDQPLILWDVDTLDWKNRDTGAVSSYALEHTVPGSVVLFHDIHESSVKAVPDVLAGLHRRGYHFVTVTDVFPAQVLEPGGVYTDARLS